MKKQSNQREQRAEQRKKAMPEVERLVKQFGRTTISSCLLRMAQRDKAAKKVEKMKRELAELESRL